MRRRPPTPRSTLRRPVYESSFIWASTESALFYEPSRNPSDDSDDANKVRASHDRGGGGGGGAIRQ